MRLALTIILLCLATATPSTAAPSTPARIPIVLELFTSEGCSSCPPADSVLEALDRQPVPNVDLIVLSEHVDYWNYLGWSDPYSSPQFSNRQRRYSERLAATVYTPQLVIDGRFQVLGSDQPEVMRTIARASQKTKLAISVQTTRSGATGTAHVETNTGATLADLYIVIAADRARSQVLRGENGGHTLSHVAVARSIMKIGKWSGKGDSARDVPLTSLTGLPGEIRVIAILEDPKTGEILGANQTRM